MALSLCGREDEAEPHFAYVDQANVAHAEIDRLNRVISANPRDVEALVTLGKLYMENANADEGVIRLLSALDLDPGNAQARQLLFEYYSEQAEKDPAYQVLADDYRPLAD
jgi:cytochrome c-type biogenesis protein CcmH/NrfG